MNSKQEKTTSKSVYKRLAIQSEIDDILQCAFDEVVKCLKCMDYFADQEVKVEQVKTYNIALHKYLAVLQEVGVGDDSRIIEMLSKQEGLIADFLRVD